MRQFVVVGHEAPTTPDFPLDDLAGGAGRLDVLCRCVTAALLTSHGVREDAVVHLVCRDEVTVSFDGAEIRGLHPDERSTAARVREALAARDEAVGRVPAEPSPGVAVRRGGLAPTLDDCEGPVLALHEDGDPVTAVDPPADATFVCSDHRDLSAAERDLLADRAARRVSLGPVALHADHAVVVAHNWLDTDGFATYGASGAADAK